MNENKPTSTEVEDIDAITEGIFLTGYVSGRDRASTYPSEEYYQDRRQAITKLIQEAELRGRIDELSELMTDSTMTRKYREALQERVDELQAQLQQAEGRKGGE